MVTSNARYTYSRHVDGNSYFHKFYVNMRSLSINYRTLTGISPTYSNGEGLGSRLNYSFTTTSDLNHLYSFYCNISDTRGFFAFIVNFTVNHNAEVYVDGVRYVTNQTTVNRDITIYLPTDGQFHKIDVYGARVAYAYDGIDCVRTEIYSEIQTSTITKPTDPVLISRDVEEQPVNGTSIYMNGVNLQGDAFYMGTERVKAMYIGTTKVQ